MKDNAKVAIDTVLTVKNGKADDYKFKGIGRLLDDALDAVEKDNPKLKGVLDKSYARWRVDEALLWIGWLLCSKRALCAEAR